MNKQEIKLIEGIYSRMADLNGHFETFKEGLISARDLGHSDISTNLVIYKTKKLEKDLSAAMKLIRELHLNLSLSGQIK